MSVRVLIALERGAQRSQECLAIEPRLEQHDTRAQRERPERE